MAEWERRSPDRGRKPARAADQSLDAYPERSVAVVRAFRAPLNRSLIVGAIVAVAVALFLVGLRVDEGFPGTIGIVVIGLVAGLVGAVVGVLAMPARMRRVFEAYSWLGHREVARFRARTGGPVPVGRGAMDHWLATTPSTPAMRLPRIELLAFVGSFDEARRELELVQPSNPEVAYEVAGLRQYIDWLEHDSTDLTELRASVHALPPGSEARLEGDVTLALVEARSRLVHTDVSWSEPLERIRPTLGWAPWRATLADTWRPIAGAQLLAAIVTALIATVLRSML